MSLGEFIVMGNSFYFKWHVAYSPLFKKRGENITNCIPKNGRVAFVMLQSLFSSPALLFRCNVFSLVSNSTV